MDFGIRRNDMTKVIPIGSIEVKEGLFLYEYSKEVGGKTMFFSQIYCADGYSFYDKNQSENYDEENNLKPENELTYAQFAYIPHGTDLSNLVVVQVKDEYVII